MEKKVMAAVGGLNKEQKKAAVQHLRRFDRNNFGIQSHLLSLIGEGVSPVGAMLNHQCHHPNVIVHTQIRAGEAPLQVFVAAGKIEKGDELRHAYFQIREDVATRKKTIESVYHFTCSCAVCQAPWKEVEAILKVEDTKEAKQALQRAAQCMRKSVEEDDLNQAAKWSAEAYQFRRKAVASEFHPLVIDAMIENVNILLMAGRMEDAAIVQEKVVEGLVTLHSLMHPAVGLQYQILAEIAQDQEYYVKAYYSLRGCYGPDHPLVVKLKEHLSSN
jgi:hypothetical protein